MKASPRQQQLLLELQAHDTNLVRLSRRRAGLPEREELAGFAEKSAAARDRFMAAQRAVEDLQAEIDRVESDVEVVRQRHQRNSARLAESVSSKEAQSLQDELTALERRKSLLEDRELELMEQLESAQQEFDSASEEIAQMNAKREGLERRIAQAEQEIDAEHERVVEARAGLAAEVQGDLRELYDRTRERYGVGAARLNGRVSEGSNMELDAADYAAVQALAPDEVYFCPVSGAILVRDV